MPGPTLKMGEFCGVFITPLNKPAETNNAAKSIGQESRLAALAAWSWQPCFLVMETLWNYMGWSVWHRMGSAVGSKMLTMLCTFVRLVSHEFHPQEQQQTVGKRRQTGSMMPTPPRPVCSCGHRPGDCKTGAPITQREQNAGLSFSMMCTNFKYLLKTSICFCHGLCCCSGLFSCREGLPSGCGAGFSLLQSIAWGTWAQKLWCIGLAASRRRSSRGGLSLSPASAGGFRIELHLGSPRCGASVAKWTLSFLPPHLSMKWKAVDTGRRVPQVA